MAASETDDTKPINEPINGGQAPSAQLIDGSQGVRDSTLPITDKARE